MIKVIRIIAFSVFCACLCSCSGKYTEDDFFAMDTYMQIQIEGNKDDVQAVRDEIYRINNLLTYENIDLSDSETYELSLKTAEISKYTDGAIDITVAPITEIWGFTDKSFRVPHDTEIEKLLPEIDYNKLLRNENPKVDFGAVGKGYAGDCSARVLRDRGVSSALLSLGGNIHTVGAKSDGSPWKIGIKNPDFDGYIGYVEVCDKAVVTSGGYWRYFEENGTKYVHILNPKTGKPANSDIKSVTVVCSSGLVADALSTAFYVMGAEETKSFCESRNFTYNGEEYGVIIIDSDNRVTTLGGVALKTE